MLTLENLAADALNQDVVGLSTIIAAEDLRRLSVIGSGLAHATRHITFYANAAAKSMRNEQRHREARETFA